MISVQAYKLPEGQVEQSYATGLCAPRTGVYAQPMNGYRNVYIKTFAPPLAVNTMFRAPTQRPLPCKPSPDMYWKENRPPIVHKERGMVPAQGLTKQQGVGLSTIGKTDYPILKNAGQYANTNAPF